VLVLRRSPQRCGRADVRSDAQENLRDANADTASKKENNRGDRDEKEIADANTNSVVITEEKTFTGR